MGINYFPGAGEAHAINQARMIELIGENNVGGLQNRAEQSDIRRVSGSEVQRRLGSGKVREFRFQVFPFARIS